MRETLFICPLLIQCPVCGRVVVMFFLVVEFPSVLSKLTLRSQHSSANTNIPSCCFFFFAPTKILPFAARHATVFFPFRKRQFFKQFYLQPPAKISKLLLAFFLVHFPLPILLLFLESFAAHTTLLAAGQRILNSSFMRARVCACAHAFITSSGDTGAASGFNPCFFCFSF